MSQQQDNRSVFTHQIHGIGHTINGTIKEMGYKGGIESTGLYRQSWSSGVDQNRAQYHFNQAKQKSEKNDGWKETNNEWPH